MEFEEIIAEKDYERIYYLLKDNHLSEKYISNLRHKGCLFVNGKECDMRTPIKKEDVIRFKKYVGKKTEIKQCDINLDIVFEDNDLLIVNKSPLLSSTPTKSHYDLNLAGAVCHYMKKENPDFVFRIINRLDKDTSGIVIIAKNLFAYNNIKDIRKRYEAVCEGKIEKDLTIDSPILTITENGINQRKRIISPLGKSAKTYISVLKSGESFSHVSLQLENGRTHQIRVHLSSIAHPLVGDEIYGKTSEFISHTALICKEVSFTHPRTKETINLTADYPSDFLNLLNQLS